MKKVSPLKVDWLFFPYSLSSPSSSIEGLIWRDVTPSPFALAWWMGCLFICHSPLLLPSPSVQKVYMEEVAAVVDISGIYGRYIIYGGGCSFLICIRLRINVHFRGNFRRIQTLPDSFQLFNMRGPFVLSHPVPPWSRLDFRNYDPVAKPAKKYRFRCHQ